MNQRQQYHWGLVREWPDGSRQYYGFGEAISHEDAVRDVEAKMLSVLCDHLAAERRLVRQEIAQDRDDPPGLEEAIAEVADLIMALAWSLGYEGAMASDAITPSYIQERRRVVQDERPTQIRYRIVESWEFLAEIS